MVALYAEYEVAIDALNSQILLSEPGSVLNVVEIAEERIAAHGKDQVEDIESGAYSSKTTRGNIDGFGESESHEYGNADP